MVSHSALFGGVLSVTLFAVTRKRQTLLTERLVLRRWQDDDLGAYAAICADPEVMRWIGRGAILSPEACAEAIASFERDWDEHGFGLFATELRVSRRLLGFIGLSVPEFLPELLPAVEIGWRLARDAWGQGLATEGASAALRFGLSELKLARIVSIHQVGNLASGRIMKKLGMRFERRTVDSSCGRSVHVYQITRPDWSRR